MSTDLWSEMLHTAARRSTLEPKRVIVLGDESIIPQLVRRGKTRETLALGYEVMHLEDDEVSVYSTSVNLRDVLPASLPTRMLSDSAVVIALDWTRPARMLPDLLSWIKWLDWAEDEGSDKLQSLVQHYVEPPGSSYTGPLLPVGPGTLTLNPKGIPLIVVCARAESMDSAGEAMGLKGTAWEERCDWVQQVLRTVCLAYGASLFYSTSLLRPYLLHRLHGEESRFAFQHRANVLDRDAIMVPTGWDSWGKINVVRDGFDPARVLQLWEQSIAGEDGLIKLWQEAVPVVESPRNTTQTSTHVEPEQAFLLRHFETLSKDPNRDPRAAFRTPGTDGVLGPVGGGGLLLPGVEKAMAEMEEDKKLGKKDDKPNEALHNFFQGLLATKGKARKE